MAQRFSKAWVREYCERRVRYLEKLWRFDADTGYAQVDGEGEEANRAYGEWSALRDLLEEIA